MRPEPRIERGRGERSSRARVVSLRSAVWFGSAITNVTAGESDELGGLVVVRLELVKGIELVGGVRGRAHPSRNAHVRWFCVAADCVDGDCHSSVGGRRRCSQQWRQRGVRLRFVEIRAGVNQRTSRFQGGVTRCKKSSSPARTPDEHLAQGLRARLRRDCAKVASRLLDSDLVLAMVAYPGPSVEPEGESFRIFCATSPRLLGGERCARVECAARIRAFSAASSGSRPQARASTCWPV